MPHRTPSLPPGISPGPATAAGDVDGQLLCSSQRSNLAAARERSGTEDPLPGFG